MTDHITLPRSVVEQLKHALENANAFSPCPMYREAFIISRAALAAQQAEPVFWYRPVGEDGGYEGPIHNASIERVRRLSGAWHPLYPHAPQPAQPVATYMGHRLTPFGTNEFWGVADAPLEPGTKLYTAPQPAQPVAVPQGWRELMREARDNCEASIAEDGVSAMRREYRKELLARIDAMLAAPMPPAATVLEPLTDSEIKKIWAEHARNIGGIFEFARAIEATHAAKLAKLNGITPPAERGV